MRAETLKTMVPSIAVDILPYGSLPVHDNPTTSAHRRTNLQHPHDTELWSTNQERTPDLLVHGRGRVSACSYLRSPSIVLFLQNPELDLGPGEGNRRQLPALSYLLPRCTHVMIFCRSPRRPRRRSPFSSSPPDPPVITHDAAPAHTGRQETGARCALPGMSSRRRGPSRV